MTKKLIYGCTSVPGENRGHRKEKYFSHLSTVWNADVTHIGGHAVIFFQKLVSDKERRR